MVRRDADGKKPLSGLRILVTRPRDRAWRLAGPLKKLGARVLIKAAIDIRPPKSWAPVDREIRRLPDYDSVVFTSATAVALFFRRLRSTRPLPPMAAVGPATAGALRERGVRPAWIAARFTAAALGRKLRGRVLHPASQPHSPDLAREARKRGAVVVEPVVYRIVRTRSGEVPKVDLVTFASAETVRSFAESSATRGTCACIGPVTARAARAAGFKVAVQPARYTIPDLIKAILAWHRRRRRS